MIKKFVNPYTLKTRNDIIKKIKMGGESARCEFI